MTTSYLLQADRQQSILSGSNSPMRAYTAYGAMPDASGPILGFAGEVRDQMTGWYHLGNGHRVYNPVLLRFHAPDRLSPFGLGGFNSYSYCLGDPVNHRDPSGRAPEWLAPAMSIAVNVLGLLLSVLRIKVGGGFKFAKHPRQIPRASVAGAIQKRAPRPSALEYLVSGISATSAVGGIGLAVARIIDPDGSEVAKNASYSFTGVTLATSILEAVSLLFAKSFNPNPNVLGQTWIPLSPRSGQSPIPRRTSSLSIRQV